MREFLRRRVIAPIMALLTQGITPEKIAMSIAIGAIVGIFPVLGTTTVLVTIAAAALRLNLVAAHTVHYVMTPVQLLLIIPFVRVGEHVVGAAPQPLTIKEGLALLGQGVWNAVVILWDAIVHAIVGWIAIGPLAIALSYLLLRAVLRRVAPTQRASESTTA